MTPDARLALARTSPPSPGGRDPRAALLIRLARALHTYGTPAHRLEETMNRVASALGLEGNFFATPTAIFASFAGEDGGETTLLRLEPGEINLEKLTRLDAIASAVADGERDPKVAVREVAAVLAAPPRYGRALTVFGFAVASATAARFFGGGGSELAAAGGVGLCIGLLALVAGRVGRLFEPLAAVLASALAATAAFSLGASAIVVTLAGLIVLLPGLSLTLAMAELASRHLAAGTARLTGAAVTFLMLGFGVALGSRLELLLPAAATPILGPLPEWSEVVALLIAPLSFLVLFQARPRNLGWILVVGIAGFEAARWATDLLGAELGTFVGGFVVGAASNVIARWRRKPAAITAVPGIMLLVPGSLGFRGVLALVEHNVMSGVEGASTATLVASALVAGLLFANLLVPARNAL